MICVLLLVCGLPVYAQQARPGLRQNQAGCMNTSGGAFERPGIPAMKNRFCKPVLPGVQPLQLSKDLSPNDDGVTFVNAEPPGAQSSSLVAINAAGTVLGSYCDANACRTFLRRSNGTFVYFDIPGAGGGVSPTALNSAETVTGNLCDANYTLCPTFVRDRLGNVTIFNPPDGVFGSLSSSINGHGTITGFYWDENFGNHGFVRDPSGALTEFDLPGSDCLPGLTCTWPTSINEVGTIVGTSFDNDGNSHGFLRTRDGNMSTFDVPGGTDTAYYTFGGGSIASINSEGQVASNYFQPIPGNPFGGNFRGMLRKEDGSFETWDASTSGPCCTWTYSTGLNEAGTITGYDNDGHDIYHGYIRSPDGVITTFDAPGAGTGRFQGTLPMAINQGGIVAGYYVDSNRVSHAFLRIPR